MASSRTRRTWRLIVDGAADAAVNMARDEAILLATANAKSGESGAYAIRPYTKHFAATLRFYSWQPWAFSLGYFQRYADFEAQARKGIPIVRRLTGGGAIYHADELTYSLVGPFGRDGFPRRAAGIFEKVHGTIREGLRALGVRAQLSDAPTGRSATICFERPQRFDIVVGERKLVGSAQRRYGRHFLQHGSLLLSANEFAPGAAALQELVAKRPSDATITEALSRAFEEAFGIRLVRGELSTDEEAAAARLAAEKYGRPEWNRRR